LAPVGREIRSLDFLWADGPGYVRTPRIGWGRHRWPRPSHTGGYWGVWVRRSGPGALVGGKSIISIHPSAAAAKYT
jgi:hypothetical protein